MTAPISKTSNSVVLSETYEPESGYLAKGLGKIVGVLGGNKLASVVKDQILSHAITEIFKKIKAEFPQVPNEELRRIHKNAAENGLPWVIKEVSTELNKVGAFQEMGKNVADAALGFAKDQLSDEERIKKISLFVSNWFQEKYKNLTSHEMEQHLSDLATQYYYSKMQGITLKELPPEEELDKEIGPQASTAAELLSDYVLQTLDGILDKAISNNPNAKRIVVDLGRKDQDDSDASKINDECVYLPALNVESFGFEVWLRRDRDKLKEDIRRAFKVGLKHLRHSLEGNFKKDPDFARNLVAEIFQAFDAHAQLFVKYNQWEKGQHFDPKDADLNRVANGLGNKLHYALQGSTDEDHRSQQKKHSAVLAKLLNSMLFPGGIQDLPFSAQYRDILAKLVLPLVGTEILNTCMNSLSDKKTLNKMLLKILNNLPKPEELAKNADSSKTPSESIDVDPVLKKAVGSFLVNMLTISEPGLGKFMDHTLDGVSKLLGSSQTNLFRAKVEAKMGELVGEVIEKMLLKYNTSEKLIDALINMFTEDFLKNQVHDDDEVVTDEQVIEKLSEVRQNLGPYIIKSFELSIKAVRTEMMEFVDKVVPFVKTVRRFVAKHIGPTYNKVTQVITDLIQAVWGWMRHFLHWDVAEKREAKFYADRQARDLLALIQHPVHQNLIRNSFDVFLFRMAGEEYGDATKSKQKKKLRSL